MAGSMSGHDEKGATVRAVAYLRVSTTEQAEHGLGLEVQRERIGQWAREAGLEAAEVAIFEDAGRSGADDVLDRPGLGAALNALEACDEKMLVVYRLDRLSRQLGIQEYIVHLIRKQGGQVVSCQPSEADALNDAGDPMRAAFRQFVGIIAQLERDLIQARTRAGKRAKRERGGHGDGPPPYGWRPDGAGGLEHDPDTWEVVLEAVELRETLWTFQQIADELNASGRVAPRGGAWTPKAVSRIIATARYGPKGCQPYRAA